MKTDINKNLAAKILNCIPKDKKPAVYLVNALNISRESAYRRIRGDIPFTMEELVTLAVNLEFSIDHILDEEKQSHAFLDLLEIEKDTKNFFLLMLKKCDELLEKTKDAKNLEALMALNSFLPPFYTNFPAIFKFSYYKWLYQDSEIFRYPSYSDMVLPEEILVYQRKIKENLNQKMNLVLILDAKVFLNLIQEIQYFYQRKLLTDKELLLLKEDVLRLVDRYEEFSQTGTFGLSKIQLYLSSLYINSNTLCYSCDDLVESLFWMFTINPVIIQNSEFASVQMKWLNSLKRQSALITQSNEITQAEFFSKQKDYINKYLSVTL